tara:strand:- start:261 stop:563 length:303 start_codon:yes stop_codon:yes gene_type:complete
MTKKEIQDYKDKRNLKYGFNAYWNKGFNEAITLLNKQEKAINYTHSCTELNHDLKIGDKVVVTNRYVATISAFCADNDLIEIEDGCDYKQVDKEDLTKVV